MWPSIYHLNRVHTWIALQLLPLLTVPLLSLIPLSCQQVPSNQVYQVNSKVSVKRSIQTLSSGNEWLIHNEYNLNTNSLLFLFFCPWLRFLFSLQAISFRFWFPPGKQNGCYLSHSALWVAVKCWCWAKGDTKCSHVRTHIVSAKEAPWKPWTETFLCILHRGKGQS